MPPSTAVFSSTITRAPSTAAASAADSPAAPEPKEDDAPELPDFLEYRPQAPARRTYRIYRTDRGFRIIGDAPVGEELEAALKAAGARKGQDVEIGDEVLEWQ